MRAYYSYQSGKQSKSTDTLTYPSKGLRTEVVGRAAQQEDWKGASSGDVFLTVSILALGANTRAIHNTGIDLEISRLHCSSIKPFTEQPCKSMWLPSLPVT